MGKVVKFPEPYIRPGNGAREAVRGWFEELDSISFKEINLLEDNLLVYLWQKGFKVVPITEG